MPVVDILLPTYNRLLSFVMTLSGIASQSLRNLHVIIADQSQHPAEHSQEVRSLLRVIEARGRSIEYHCRPPIHGIAEQRDFLLNRATAQNVLYLDDDVFMEPWVIEKLLEVLQSERCGFVGAFPAGLSHRDDVRPQQQIVEYWEGSVQPEAIDPASPQWERWQLHRAANHYHVSQSLNPGEFRLYKVAYYSQVPSTVLNDAGTVDGHALDLLAEMIEKYAPETPRVTTVSYE
jgi:glycosyltransferase involved in cell wall biosynthesis